MARSASSFVRTTSSRCSRSERSAASLRGLAVLGVLLFHAQLWGMRGGFLGVSAFFTLSGFLITSLLLDEHDRTGRIALRPFWARRGHRLLPAAYVTLAAVIGFGATIATADQLRSLRGDVVAALAYVANWRFYVSGQSYEHLFNAPSPVLHFWSLSVEEQFYLLWPVVLLAMYRATRRVAHQRRAMQAIVAMFVNDSGLGNL